MTTRARTEERSGGGADWPPANRAVLIGLTVVGLALRAISLNARGFWLDEVITVTQARQSLRDIFVSLAVGGGVHPPLYHVLVHFWMALFGQGEVAVRAFSVVFGTASIPVAYWAAKRIYDKRTGIIAAGLVALSPYLIWYSQEARMYILMWFASLLSIAFLVLAVDENRARWWLGYLAATIAGLFTHYLYVFLLAGQIAFYVFAVLIRQERERRRQGAASFRTLRPWGLFTDVPTLAPWFACMIAAGTLDVIWLASSIFAQQNPLLSAAEGSGLGYGLPPARLAFRFNDLAAVFVQMIAGFHSQSTMDLLVASWPVLIFVFFLLIHLVKPVTWRTWVLLASASGVVVLMLLGQWQEQILVSRYFIAVAAPLLLLVSRLMAKLRRHAVMGLAAALVAVSAVAWADQSYDPQQLMRYDYREAFGTITEDWRPGDVVLYVPWYLDSLADYYLPSRIPAYGMPMLDAAGNPRNQPRQVGQDLDRVVGAAPRVWLLLSYQDLPRVAEDGDTVRLWLAGHGYTVAMYEPMSRVLLTRYDGGEGRRRFFVFPRQQPTLSRSAEPGSRFAQWTGDTGMGPRR